MKFPKINNFKNPLKQVKYDIYMKKIEIEIIFS